MQNLFQLQQPLRLRLSNLADRDFCPYRNNIRDILFCHKHLFLLFFTHVMFGLFDFLICLIQILLQCLCRFDIALCKRSLQRLFQIMACLFCLLRRLISCKNAEFLSRSRLIDQINCLIWQEPVIDITDCIIRCRL